MAKKPVVRNTTSSNTTTVAGITAASNPTATATQRTPAQLAVAQAGATYNPTQFGITGGWADVKRAAIDAANAKVTSDNLASKYGTGAGYNPITGAITEPVTGGGGAGGGTEPITGGGGPVNTGTVDTGTGEVTGSGNAQSKWTIEGDLAYQKSLQGAQSAFNSAKANAMLKMQAQQNALTNQILAMDQNAPDANRALADSFAVRGMQRGDYGAYYRAQDKQNAALLTAQTDIRDQISSLSQDFLSTYGTAGSDWLGTAQGQEARNQAIQLALQNRLAQSGVTA